MRRFVALAAMVVLFATSANAATVLITGTNRGLGFEFTRQFAEKGWEVIATARNPESADELKALAAKHKNITLEKVDVTDPAGVKALAAKLKDKPIDLLLNNAGFFGNPDHQVVGKFEYDTFQTVMAVNVYGPLQMTEAFLPNVLASTQKKVVSLTSGAGSVERTGRGNTRYFYRASKTALNIVMRGFATDFKDKGLVVGIIAPGVAETDMLVDAGLVGKGIPPAESVMGMIKVIEGLTPETSAAHAINYNGDVIPW